MSGLAGNWYDDLVAHNNDVRARSWNKEYYHDSKACEMCQEYGKLGNGFLGVPQPQQLEVRTVSERVELDEIDKE